MKKLKLIIALWALVITSKSQNSFGIATYTHANSWLTSGTVTILDPGFLLAGCQLTIGATSSYNFNIDRLDKGGVPGTASFNFQNNYKIFGNAVCGVPSQIQDCAGISIIERSSVPYSPYALAGAMNFGCFFATLDYSGSIVNQMAYLFPITPTHVSKPLITKSLASPKELYITGSYDGIMYILRVDSNGFLQSQYVTDITGWAKLEPMALIESPFGSNDLTIVGTLNSNVSGQDGFFYQIPSALPATGPTVFNRYDITSGNNNNNVFTSLVAANTLVAPYTGFLIGGGSVASNSNPGFGWAVQTDATGNVNWSTVINGSFGNGKIYGVAQRFGTVSSIYENYASCAAPGGISVYKLDDSGIPFSINYPPNNDEFYYNAGSVSGPFPVNLTYLQTGYGLDEGLHIYGNLEGTGPGNYYFVESYFNGINGCEQLANITGFDQAAPSVTAVNTATGSSLTQCTSFNITVFSNNPYNAICGPASSVPGGSNNRMLVTNVPSSTILKSELIVSPNPTNGKTHLSYTVNNAGIVRINLYNSLGQLIKSIKNENYCSNGEYNAEIDLAALNIKSGVYFLKSNINGKSIEQKIIYMND